MAYIGKSPIIGNFVKLDAITAVNGQAAYTMQNGGSNFTDYESVNQFLVSLNGTIQAPTDSFTVSGSTLTFASNLSTGDVIDFIMVFGNSLSAGTPTDATVSTAKIVDDAVTAAKINNDIISGSTELATEPADTDEFLVSDAGTLKRIDYSLIKGGGKVLQVVQGTKTDTSTISSGFADIGLSASITPSATSSKILIMCQITCTSVASDNNPISTYLRLLRGSTAISQADSAGSRTLVTTEVGGAYYPDDQTNATIIFLDSPSTTSATTYKIQGSDRDLGSGTLYIGRGLNDQDIAQRGRGTSNIVLTEVGA